MTVARISIMGTSADLTRTASDKKAEVERLLDDLEEHLPAQTGYVLGFRFANQDDEQEVVRVSLWGSHADADHAATQERTMAIRSRIHALIDPSHLESLVDVMGDPKNIPAPHS